MFGSWLCVHMYSPMSLLKKMYSPMYSSVQSVTVPDVLIGSSTLHECLIITPSLYELKGVEAL
jgi:hypothetical protein